MTSPADLSPAPTRVRYTVLAWACSLSMLTYIDRVCIKRVEGPMSADLGLEPTQFVWVYSAFALSYSLCEVPSGWMGDRFGPRKVLIRIVLWWSLFTALTGAVPRFDSVAMGLGLLLLVRLLFGMGEAGAYPNMARGLRNWFPYRRRGFAQGLLWMFGRWGGAVAPPLIATLAGLFGWRGAFVAFGVIGAVWVAAFAWFFRDSPKDHPHVNDAERALILDQGREEGPPPPISWRTILSSRTLWLLCAMYLCSNAGWCFFITLDTRYYKEVLHQSDGFLNYASGIPLFCGGIACLLGGFTTDWTVRKLGPRWGRTLQGSLANLLGATFFLLALAMPNPYLVVASLCVASFCKDFSMAVSWSTCLDVGHRYSGSIAGFMNMVGNLGTVIAPPINAYFADRGQWHLVLVFSAGMFSIASVCWLFINPARVIVYAASSGQAERQGN
jgi:ACS family glucarate transporter-like MFS transporter